MDDKDALQAWDIIVRLGVDPGVLESRLLELWNLEVPTASFPPRSRKEHERAIRRIERVAEDITHLGLEFSDVLSGPLPPHDTHLGILLGRVPPGAQALTLHEWLLHFASAVKQRLNRPQRSQKRLRFPDAVHTVGAEIVHLCVVASSSAELDPQAQAALRKALQSRDPWVLRIKPTKLPEKPHYCYEHVVNLCNAVLAAVGLERTLDARSLRRAYNSLHPRLAAALKADRQRARKGNMRPKKA